MGVPVVSCGHDHANDYCVLSDDKDVPLKARQEKSESASDSSSADIPPADIPPAEAADSTDPLPSSSAHPQPPKPKLKNNKIWLCYGGGVGFGGYGGYDGYIRRIRFFEYDANEAKISTWKRLEWGDVQKRVDEQVIVHGGRVITE